MCSLPKTAARKVEDYIIPLSMNMCSKELFAIVQACQALSRKKPHVLQRCNDLYSIHERRQTA